MTQIERRIRHAQHRLWLNRWLYAISICLAIAAFLFAGMVLLQRLFDWSWPLWLMAEGLGCAGLVVSLVWAMLRREDAATAAATLDRAAGLRERISSGHYCLDKDDPFARAVVCDAERLSASLSVRNHIPLKVPSPVGWTAGSVVLAALMFLITPGLLKRTEATENNARQAEVVEAKIAVKRKMEQLHELAEKTPALRDMMDDLDDTDSRSAEELQKPGMIRHEAIKKIDRLEDALKKKRNSSDYEAMRQMRKMMRRIKPPASSDAPTRKLAKSLQRGDFKTAREEIKALREQLATLKSKEDKEMVRKISQQLDALSKQLQKVAVDKKLVQKLEQAGIKKEDLKRMLEHLKKEDLDQLKKKLQQKGLNQKQIQKLAKQLQQQQKAGSLAKKLAQAMQSNGPAGQAGGAMAGLSQAGKMLGELETLEQEMNQLDSAMATLNDAKNALDQPCSLCKGTGMVKGGSCPRCGGSGRNGNRSGMGGVGHGRGGLAPQQKTSVGFKMKRGKVPIGKGSIIGQMLVEGEQVPGKVSSSVEKIITAAQRDASDRINRDRIPRQYQKAVKAYFSDMSRAKRHGASSSSSGAANGDEDYDGNETPSPPLPKERDK